MIFVDEVSVDIAAGNGGRGAVAFRKEKYVPHGGPSGGDGGKGGDIVLEADSNLSTLLDFQFQHKYSAKHGVDGASKDMYGKDAVDLVLKAPIGTVATDVATGRILADLTVHGQREIIAKGGRGGKGNSHFASSTNQAPKYAENGDPGEGFRIKLELKLLADVGIIGFPNVGKSSLIAAVSAVRPKIADYPFTTLIPNLGVVKVDDDPSRTFVMADIPGLIEGAHEGTGLGHQFLRHIERTRLLVHVIDVSPYTGRDPLADYITINKELANYSERLSKLPQIIALNKIDVADEETVKAVEVHLQTLEVGEIFKISAATGSGTKPLIYAVAEKLAYLKSVEETPIIPEGVMRITPETMAKLHPGQRRTVQRKFSVAQAEDGAYLVVGEGMERMVAITPLDNDHAVRRLQRVLEKSGVYTKLKAAGAKDGDTVRIGTVEFEYIDEDFEDTLDDFEEPSEADFE